MLLYGRGDKCPLKSVREGKMSLNELSAKAAECTRAIDATSDPKVREMLIHLRTLWINLADDSQRFGDAALVKQIAMISRIHTDLTHPTAK